jgi:hypothetical protein
VRFEDSTGHRVAEPILDFDIHLTGADRDRVGRYGHRRRQPIGLPRRQVNREPCKGHSTAPIAYHVPSSDIHVQQCRPMQTSNSARSRSRWRRRRNLEVDHSLTGMNSLMGMNRSHEGRPLTYRID